MERQLAIKLDERHRDRLDAIAQRLGVNRNFLMTQIVRTWLYVLGTSGTMFQLGIVLHGVLAELNEETHKQRQFSKSIFPEKGFPFKVTEEEDLLIEAMTATSVMSKHAFMRAMILVGVGELEDLTASESLSWSDVAERFRSALQEIMEEALFAVRMTLKRRERKQRQQRSLVSSLSHRKGGEPS